MKKTRIGKRIRLSNHAILRWLERIDGMDIEEIKQEMRKAGRTGFSDFEIVEYLKEWHKLNRATLRTRILTQEIKNLIRMGAKHVHLFNRKFFLVVEDTRECHHIVTINKWRTTDVDAI